MLEEEEGFFPSDGGITLPQFQGSLPGVQGLRVTHCGSFL